ncbi:MAG TPA: PPC domain-containing protein, partial [Candidatus Latescibacteria bacterium]|nr:PPC domain-containing protein [Candidatus Latescibacterota bacterium]
MRKLFSLGTAFLCLSALALAQVKQETEPNGQRLQAQEIRLGDTVEGGFQQNNDDDWYKFNVDQPGRNYIRIDLSAVPEVDTRMYLLDANGGTLLGVNDAKKNEAESIAFVAVEPGTYFVHVFGAGKAAGERYSLSLKLDGPWQEGQEFEPNDRREQANDLSLGKSIEGHFQRTGDNDYFRLRVDKPGKHDIQVDLSALPDYNQQFVIQDKDGKELWSAKGRPKGEPESVNYFTVTEGVYYIWVRGSQKQIADKYTLSTRILGPWREDEEAEPNDEM